MTNLRLGDGMKFESYGNHVPEQTAVLAASSLNPSTGLNNSDVIHSL